MHRALGEYIIRGIKTTIPLHRAIFTDPVFCEGHSVVANIVRLAAMEVPGVCGIGGGLVDGLADSMFPNRASDRGVKILADDEGAYSIEIRAVMTFGTEIGRTAVQVQMTVRKQVELMTGNRVKRVDVIIEGVKMPTVRKEAAPAAEEEWPELPHTD
jgi:uncharacterized alkaline shock family protein YloU